MHGRRAIFRPLLLPPLAAAAARARSGRAWGPRARHSRRGTTLWCATAHRRSTRRTRLCALWWRIPALRPWFVSRSPRLMADASSGLERQQLSVAERIQIRRESKNELTALWLCGSVALWLCGCIPLLLLLCGARDSGLTLATGGEAISGPRTTSKPRRSSSYLMVLTTRQMINHKASTDSVVVSVVSVVPTMSLLSLLSLLSLSSVVVYYM